MITWLFIIAYLFIIAPINPDIQGFFEPSMCVLAEMVCVYNKMHKGDKEHCVLNSVVPRPCVWLRVICVF